MNEQDMSAIELIKQFHLISWDLADFFRDKRFSFKEGEPFRPKAGTPEDLLKKLVSLNHMCSEALVMLHNPNNVSHDSIEETIIDEVELNKETISKLKETLDE